MAPTNYPQAWPVTWLTNTATATSACITNVTWAAWTASATTTNVTWPAWNELYEARALVRQQFLAPRAPPPPTYTPEQRRQREAQVAAERIAAEERLRVFRAEQAARAVLAEKSQAKGIALLLSAISEQQRKDLLEHDYFFVTSEHGNLYRIDRGRHLNVRFLDPVTRKVMRTYCAYTTNDTPDGDSMLAQKLMLECMEDRFLEIALMHQHEPPPHQNNNREGFLRLAGAEALRAQA